MPATLPTAMASCEKPLLEGGGGGGGVPEYRFEPLEEDPDDELLFEEGGEDFTGGF